MVKSLASPAERRHSRLKIAVVSGDAETVHALLFRGDDPNEVDANGATLLIHAAARGHVDVCRALLDAGADPFCLDCYGKDAGAYARRSGFADVLDALERVSSNSGPEFPEVAGVSGPNDRASARADRHEDDSRTRVAAHGAAWKDIPEVPDAETEQRMDELRREMLAFAPESAPPDEELAAVVDELLDHLPPLEAQILRLRFGLDGEQELSRDDVARRYGLTSDQISQLEAKTLRALRDPSRSERLRRYLEDEE